jgi:hypothetical protein
MIVEWGPRWALYGGIAGGAGTVAAFLKEIPWIGYTCAGVTGAFFLCGGVLASIRWNQDRIREQNLEDSKRSAILLQYKNPNASSSLTAKRGARLEENREV